MSGSTQCRTRTLLGVRLFCHDRHLVGIPPHLIARLLRCRLNAREQIHDPMSTLTVWHDGSCPLCQREIALMGRLDRSNRITFVDAARVAEESCPIDRADLLARFHACEDGVLLSGAAAFAAMWRAIPALRPLGLLSRNRLALAALERTYRVFLRARPWLQRAAWKITSK
jgi:predicted DCC family thiol-disulfide oxidoreductase YuxK